MNQILNCTSLSGPMQLASSVVHCPNTVFNVTMGDQKAHFAISAVILKAADIDSS